MHAAQLGPLVQASATQAGVVSARQAAALGVSRRQLRDAVEAGILQRLHPSVYRIGSGPPPPLAEIHAAVLAVGVGSIPSHESAFHLHCVDRVPFHPVVSTGPTGRANVDGVRVHRVRDLHPEHICVVDGVTTTTLERALVDVATVFSRVRTEWLLDHLTVTTGRASLGRIARVLRQVNHKGRTRIGDLVGLLVERGPSAPTPRSLLERAADELLAMTSLPVAAREHPLPSSFAVASGQAEGFVDRAWPDIRLIVEIDGRPWHARERDMARDRRRDRGAAAVGWQTLRILGEEINDTPDEVAREVVDAYVERSALFARPV